MDREADFMAALEDYLSAYPEKKGQKKNDAYENLSLEEQAWRAWLEGGKPGLEKFLLEQEGKAQSEGETLEDPILIL
jgi:hypothetical protein